jgi:hypothetical protein
MIRKERETMATPEQEAMERRWQCHEQEAPRDPDQIGPGMRGWVLLRVEPEVFQAMHLAAADGWVAVSDYMRAALIARLRAEDWLPPARRAPTLNANEARPA